MLPTIQLADNLMVSGQPMPSDLEGLSALGVTTVVCNRPDGEGPDQPTMDALEAVLEPQGIKLVRYPVNPADFPGDDLSGLGTVFDQNNGKVYAFCRTGTRSANLWALTRSVEDRDAALATGRAAGFDMAMAERCLG